MAMHSSFLLLLLAFSAPLAAMAGDPDILTDFIVPPILFQPLNGSFFTFIGFRALVNASAPTNFTAMKASMGEFPALEGQSVSYAALSFGPGSVNPPHTHPRSAELLLLLGGSLTVGFVDTTNKLYTQTLMEGDMFVFPKSLVHFQFNQGTDAAFALSAFGSANPGLVSVPTAVFGTAIDDGILAKSFNTDVATIQKIKAGFAAAPRKA